MNILYVAPTSDFATQVESALTSLGHTVSFLDDRVDYAMPAPVRPSRFVWSISRRIPWLRRRANDALQRQIYSSAKGHDLVLAAKGMNVRRTTLTELRRLGVRTAVWFPDNAANEPYKRWVREVGPLWDHFFSFDTAIYDQIPAMAHSRVHVLPFGVEVSSYAVHPFTDTDRKEFSSEICFIGAPYPDRVRLLQSVADKGLKIWGWQGWTKTPLAALYRGPLSASDSAKAYSLAKICVNTNILPHANGVNIKTFEICASGGFQLTDECCDLERSFVPGKELDVFTDSEDFSSKVRYWTTHEAERRDIARAGFERVARDHTLHMRLSELVRIATA